MAKFTVREYRVGDYWLSQRAGSAGWYRTWYDEKAEQTRRIALGTADLSDAKEKLEAWFVGERLKLSRHLAASDVTLAEIFKEYFDNHGSKLRSAGTIKILLRYWLEFWGAATVEEVRDVQRQEDFRKFLFDKGLRHNSVNRTLEIGRAALNRALRRHVLASVPFVECLKVENVRPMGRHLNREELQRLYWLGSEEPHFRLYTLLAITTAARPEALYTLTWEQVDFKNNLIFLNPEGRSQTSKRRPVVKMGKTLKTELRKLSRDTPRVIMFRGRKLGRMVSIWEKVRERAKLKGRVNSYSLRHTSASWMRAKGVPPWEVSAQLGHKLEGHSMTERYTHLDPSYLKTACATLDGLMSFVLTHPLQYRATQPQKTLKKAA